MEFKHLAPQEVTVLKGFVENRQINQAHLPFGGSIFWDSMGVWRDPLTDKLYPSSVEVLKSFSPMLRANNLLFGVATNGPIGEVLDIFANISYPIPGAVGIAEGGGIAIHANPWSGFPTHKIIVSKRQIKQVEALETLAKKDPLMNALLSDRDQKDAPPIRTPYATNVVLTLPPHLEILERRLAQEGLILDNIIPRYNPSTYVSDVLNYVKAGYLRAIEENPRLELDHVLEILIKEQNRRIYVTPKHTTFNTQLNKSGGAVASSIHVDRKKGFLRDYRDYEPENSIYIADKAVSFNPSGNSIINPAERSMIITAKTFQSGPHRFANVLRVIEEGLIPGVVYAEVSCRLAVNVTLDDKLPKMETVEGVPFLHIGSGHKAAEALTLLYEEEYGEAD